MTEETKLLWGFIFEAMTAFGTVGAVVISLAATLWPRRRFKIHKIDVSAIKSHVHINNDGYDECYLRIDVENLLEFQMQIFEAKINFDTQSGLETLVLPFENNSFVPAKGRYHVKVKLPEDKVKKGVCTNNHKTRIVVGTSFGDQTHILRDTKLLCDIIESEDEYTRIETGRT
jgi:hypothetical protein